VWSTSRYEKFAIHARVKSKRQKSEENKNPLRVMLIAFCMPKYKILNNERKLGAAAIRFTLEDQLKKSEYITAANASTSNGQI